MVQPDSAILARIFGADSHFALFLSQYKLAIAGVLAFVVTACFVFCIINISKLATSAGDASRRREAIIGIGISGGCIAVLGSLSVFYALVLSLL